MQQLKVKFNNVEQIRQFITIIEKFDTNFDLGAGRRVVDAKSILGVMALDITLRITRLRRSWRLLFIPECSEQFVMEQVCLTYYRQGNA